MSINKGNKNEVTIIQQNEASMQKSKLDLVNVDSNNLHIEQRKSDYAQNTEKKDVILTKTDTIIGIIVGIGTFLGMIWTGYRFLKKAY